MHCQGIFEGVTGVVAQPLKGESVYIISATTRDKLMQVLRRKVFLDC